MKAALVTGVKEEWGEGCTGDRSAGGVGMKAALVTGMQEGGASSEYQVRQAKQTSLHTLTCTSLLTEFICPSSWLADS